MNRIAESIEELDLVSKVADMKELQYQNMLLTHALIQLLADRQLIDKDEVLEKAREIDRLTLDLDHPM